MALDIGKKRIGLAVTDELGITAQGIETLERTRIREDIERLGRLATERSIDTLLVGYPLHLSGSESRQSEYTKQLAERLGRSLGLPVVYWDERLTSREAERMLQTAGASLSEKRRAIDRLSAVLLLESYLGFLTNQERAAREDSLG